MASNAELLKKAKKKFTPTRYRAWEAVYEKPLEKQGDKQGGNNNRSKIHTAEAFKKNNSNNSDINPISKLNRSTQPHTKSDTKHATYHTAEHDTFLDVGTSIDKDKIESLKLLSGNSKKIVSFFISECIKNKSNSTALLNNAYISQFAGIKRGSIRNTINRLIKKGILQKKAIKNGGAGTPSKYSIPITIYNYIGSDLNRDFVYGLENNNQIQDFNKTELPELWTQINFERLKDYGFSYKHINQIEKLGLVAPDDLQNSIDHFAFDLLENNKASEIKKSPVEFFMGIMRGQGFYTAPKNYESPQDRKLRLKLEQAKDQQQKRDEMESELVDVEFKSWVSGISASEKNKLMPEEVKNSRFEAERESFLKKYFKDNYWIGIQQGKYADCF